MFFFDNFTKLSTNRPRGLVQLFNNIKRSLEMCKQFAKKKKKKKKKKKRYKVYERSFPRYISVFFQNQIELLLTLISQKLK